MSLFQTMIRLGSSCGLPNIEDEIKDLRTKTLDLFSPKMKNLRGLFTMYDFNLLRAIILFRRRFEIVY